MTQALDKDTQLELLKAQDLEIEIAMEMKRREQAERLESQPVIVSRYQAYASASPLNQFVKDAFPVLEKGKEYRHNWHIVIICDLLQAVTLGDVRNVIINIPRRTMKSLLVCVMWVCWVWTFIPTLRYIFTSYSQDFAKRDNGKCQKLINSSFYQQRWGNIVHLDTERKELIENSAGGFRQVFKIGHGTGAGGDIVVADDPNAIDAVESEKIIEKTNTGWNEIAYHNVTDRQTASRIIIQQRTAPDDVTGNILSDPLLKALYTVLCLPMKYDTDHPHTNTKERPLYLGKVTIFDKAQNDNLEVGEDKLWIDPRDLDAPTFENGWYREWYRVNFAEKGLTSRGEGQLLWEDYIDEKVIKEEVAHLKAYGESSQFQQRPIARGGIFFNPELFLDKDKKSIQTESLDFNNMSFVRYWDKAGTTGAGDWTVGMLIGRTNKRPYKLYIIDVVRKQVSYYDRMQLMIETARQDYQDYVLTKTNTEYVIEIEKEGNSSGKDLAQIERDALLGYIVYTTSPRTSKAHRAKTPKSIAEAGRLKVCYGSWTDGFLARLQKYDPKRKSQVDDEVDTLSGATQRLLFGDRHQEDSESGY